MKHKEVIGVTSIQHHQTYFLIKLKRKLHVIHSIVHLMFHIVDANYSLCIMYILRSKDVYIVLI